MAQPPQVDPKSARTAWIGSGRPWRVLRRPLLLIPLLMLALPWSADRLFPLPLPDDDLARVVLAEDVRLLAQSLGAASGRPKTGGEPQACRIRVPADEQAQGRLAALRKVCEEHPGGVPVFVHVLVSGVEVVVRSRGV